MQAARRAARPCARHPTAPSGHAAPPRRTRPARFMPAGKEGNGSRSAPINTIDALQAVPEFERVLPAGAASSCAAAFALDAHARLLRAASLRLAGASGGEALGAARTAFSDDAGRFVRRSKDGGMVIHAQVWRLQMRSWSASYEVPSRKPRCLQTSLQSCHFAPRISHDRAASKARRCAPLHTDAVPSASANRSRHLQRTRP